MSAYIYKLRSVLVLASLFFFASSLYAEDNEAPAEENANSSETNTADADNSKDNSANDTLNHNDTAKQQDSTNNNSSQQQATPQDAVQPAPQDAAAQPPTTLPAETAAATVPSGDRFVRYVMTDATPVLSTPGGQEVLKLSQGDPIVVQMEGAWGKLTEGHYVAADKISEKPIARNKDINHWAAH